MPTCGKQNKDERTRPRQLKRSIHDITIGSPTWPCEQVFVVNLTGNGEERVVVKIIGDSFHPRLGGTDPVLEMDERQRGALAWSHIHGLPVILRLNTLPALRCRACRKI
jgi:hypothetical protein